jgi:hypothetical protein
MRNWLAVAALLCGGLVWSANARASQQAQFGTAMLVEGERVTLYSHPDINVGRLCEVIAISGDFVGCKGPAGSAGFGRPPREAWYNLRLVARIDRPVRE